MARIKKLSIIIPVYNVEDYIERCIRSLEEQDMPKEDFEIIVVNDGSPDNSKDIVEQLQKEFPNIVLINQENQGVSMARNNAIAIANGEYMLPIDPDDYIVPNVLQLVYQNAKSRDLDVLYLPYEIFDLKGDSYWETDYSDVKDIIFSGVEGYFAPRSLTTKDPDRSWAILYKLDLLKRYSIIYPKNVPYLEDGLFLGKVFTVAEKVGFINTKFYQRTTRVGSATNSRLFYTQSAIEGFIKAVHDIKAFGQHTTLNKEQEDLINHVVAKFVILSLSPSINTLNFKAYFKTISFLKKSGINNIKTKGLRMNYLQLAKVYNLSNVVFPFYFRLYKHIEKRF